MPFLGNSMLTFQWKQKFCTAFHGFDMIGWSITIGGRIINKTAILPKWVLDRIYGMAIFEAIFWFVINQSNNNGQKIWIFRLIIVWLHCAYTYVAQSNKWNYYLTSLLYHRFWLDSHTLAICAYLIREVEHYFDDYYSEYYTEKAFEWYEALLYLDQNRWVKSAMRYHPCLWISNLTEIHFS